MLDHGTLDSRGYTRRGYFWTDHRLAWSCPKLLSMMKQWH